MFVTKTAFDSLMQAFDLPLNAPLAIGVSGGADSLCLAWLLRSWAHAKKHPIVALTVNHHLRPEAEDEAAYVGQLMTQWGISHHVLSWEGKKPTTRIEEKAREARYHLMQAYCQKNNIEYLCLAHHREDQMETFLSRLSHGSGVDGLAAIKPISKRENLTLLRPLLGLAKQDLINTLRKNEITWCEDPMNQDMSYERVRWRSSLPALFKMGLTPEHITRTTKRLYMASKALDFYADEFMRHHVFIDPMGYARIDSADFNAQPFETRVRVLGKVLTLIGQPAKMLSLESLEKAVSQIPTQLTLGECHIISHKRGLFIAKESARQEGAKKIPARTWTKWDRFWIWTDQATRVKSGAPNKRIKDLPYLVQQSFPSICPQKTVEKNAKLDYKGHSTYIETHIQFSPKNKG